MPQAPKPVLVLIPTTSLKYSTSPIRNLLTACSESRSSILDAPQPFLPHQIILRPPTGQNCGILRCNFSRDVILLENISDLLLVTSKILLSGRDYIYSFKTLLGQLQGVENLGLDFLGSHTAYGSLPDPPTMSSAFAGAVWKLANALGRLKGVWIYAPRAKPGRVCELDGDDEEDEVVYGKKSAAGFSNGDVAGGKSEAGNIHASSDLMDDADSQYINWYGGEYAGDMESEAEAEGWWRRVPYHELLRSLEQVAIHLQDMLQLPPSCLDMMTELEAVQSSVTVGWLQRVKVGILGHFEGNWCFKRDMTMAVPLLGEDLVSWMRLHLDGGGGGWHVESHYSDDDWEESNGLWSWRQITENIYR